MTTIKIVWLPDADQSLPLPTYQTDGAAGADLCANLPPDLRRDGITLVPNARALIPTGLSVEIPHGFEGQIRPRSGLALKHGIMLPNSPGTIDSDYRGPLGVILLNAGTEPFRIAHGDRIAQIVVAPVVQATFALTEILPDTDRGIGGFGSTGVRP